MSSDPVKAWRIKKGDLIPQWLEETTNCEIFAGADLIVIEGEEIGFDVYFQDPDILDNAVMFAGKPINPDIETTIIGAPTNLKASSGMWDELRGQKARIEALEAENAELKKYAHEATKVITNLAGGGSELFGKELSGVFLADLSACAKRIRDRHERIHKICRDIARRAREGGGSNQ